MTAAETFRAADAASPALRAALAERIVGMLALAGRAVPDGTAGAPVARRRSVVRRRARLGRVGA